MRQEYYIVVACDYFVFIKRIHFSNSHSFIVLKYKKILFFPSLTVFRSCTQCTVNVHGRENIIVGLEERWKVKDKTHPFEDCGAL